MNNNAKINNNLLNNSTDTGRITILLVVLGFLLIVFVAIMGYINYKRYNQLNARLAELIHEEESIETDQSMSASILAAIHDVNNICSQALVENEDKTMALAAQHFRQLCAKQQLVDNLN